MFYLLGKTLQSLFALLGVATLVFFLFTVLPGDPAQMMLDQNENSEQIKSIRNKFGFDLPIIDQYFYYLNDLSPISFHSLNKNNFSHYDPHVYGGKILFKKNNYVLILKSPYFRTSYQKLGKPVNKIIKETLPNTAILAVSSIIIAVLIGLLFGIISTIYKDQFIDRTLL